jgi:hypothetical protein
MKLPDWASTWEGWNMNPAVKEKNFLALRWRGLCAATRLHRRRRVYDHPAERSRRCSLQDEPLHG